MTTISPAAAWCRVFLMVVAVLGTSASARGEDSNPGGTELHTNPKAAGQQRWNVIAECQMVVLPQKAALPLIPDLSDDDRIEAAWVKLQQMIQHDEATLVGNLTVRGEAGQNMVAESFKEVRYATEFTPPQLPTTIPKLKPEEFLKHWPHVGITPTAFETRNVGTSLELTANISDDGQWISMHVVPHHVRFLRFVKIDAGILSSGERLSVEQPYFSVLTDTMAMHVRAGQRVLIGMHNVPEEEDKMELFIVRVRAHATGDPK